MANNMYKNEYRKEEVKTKANGHLKIVANTISYNGGDLATDQNKFNEVLFKNLDSFSEEKKTAFILKYIDDVPLQEISEILGIPIGTVKSGLHYTTKILAEILKPFKP
jgi:RNA polymerase sigma factor (sigma-70 family)